MERFARRPEGRAGRTIVFAGATCQSVGMMSRSLLQSGRVQIPVAWRGLRVMGACVLALLTGAQAATPEKPPLTHEMMAVANGCFVETVAFLDHWHERFGANAWARMVQWGAKAEDEVVAGHAVAVGEAQGRLWCWDINFGWRPVPVDAAKRENAEAVAAPIVARYAGISARFPLYRFDFPQAAEDAPPTAQPANPNPSFRDASIVGATLSEHRPVNVVRFLHGPTGQQQESAAVVFVFHGRYCVYVPEIGTVPFRARGSVENLRMIQQCLIRLLPGTNSVRKL